VFWITGFIAPRRAWRFRISKIPQVIFTLWWISQWVDERKARIAAAQVADPATAAAILAHFRSYKEWVRTSQARMTAGMDGTNTAPATPE
jgi:hypothetical protein